MEHFDAATLHTARCIFATITALLSAYLAHRGGRNPTKWFCIGAVLGLFGVLPIFFLPNWKKSAPRRVSTAPRPKILFIDGPSNKLWYYLDAAQAQAGPMSLTALTSAWREGKISPATYVWHDELSEWKPLQEFIKAQTT